MIQIRVLAVSDLRQDRQRYHALAGAVETHHPNAVALVGDFLEPRPRQHQFTPIEAARCLAHLPVEQVVCCRGEREGTNWEEFRFLWPHNIRPLIALYGSACPVGPLSILGFPCHRGNESAWARSMPKVGCNVILNPFQSGRAQLPKRAQAWMPPLMQEIGPAGRALWLMHEPPLGRPSAKDNWNREWQAQVEKYQPMVVVSGHDIAAPMRNGNWLAKIGKSYCINVGQVASELSYAVIDFMFTTPGSSAPSEISVSAFSWQGGKKSTAWGSTRFSTNGSGYHPG